MADISITPSAVVFSAAAVKGQNLKSGEAIDAGEPILAVDGVWMVADANDPTRCPATALAGNSAPGANQPLQAYVSDPALTIGAHGAGLAIPLFLSANAGKICPLADVSTGNQTQLVCITKTTTTVEFAFVGGTVAHA